MTTVPAGELNLFRQSLLHNQRLDGRQNHESRQLILQAHSLIQSEGSASLLVDDTQISVGVKAELSTTNRDQLIEQYYEVTIMGAEGEDTHRTEMEMVLGAFIRRLLQEIQESLVVSWGIVYTQANSRVLLIILSLDMGLAVVVALLNTKLPCLKANINQLTDQLEFELEDSQATWLLPKQPLQSIVLLQVGQVNGQYIVDLNAKEYMSCQAVYTLVVENDRVVSMQLSRGGGAQAMGLLQVPVVGLRQARLLMDRVDEYLGQHNTAT